MEKIVREFQQLDTCGNPNQINQLKSVERKQKNNKFFFFYSFFFCVLFPFIIFWKINDDFCSSRRFSTQINNFYDVYYKKKIANMERAIINYHCYGRRGVHSDFSHDRKLDMIFD